MKNFVSFFGKIGLVLFLFIGIAGCKKKDCSSTVCGYNQVCNSGNCYCRDGYEGDSCNVLSYPRYLNNGNNYIVQEICSGSSGTNYTAFITHNSFDVSQIEINNFFNRTNFYSII